MDAEEAKMFIQAIPEIVWDMMSYWEEEAIKIAFKSLDKQIPKKPIYSDYDDNGFDEIIPYKAVCPICGYEFEFGYWNDEDNHHCVCGQLMDWEE